MWRKVISMGHITNVAHKKRDGIPPSKPTFHTGLSAEDILKMSKEEVKEWVFLDDIRSIPTKELRTVVEKQPSEVREAVNDISVGFLTFKYECACIGVNYFSPSEHDGAVSDFIALLCYMGKLAHPSFLNKEEMENDF